MRKPTAIAAFWVLGMGLAGGPALAAPLPATLAKALEGAELDTADAWAYRKATKVDAMDEPAVQSVVQWDPSKPEGERCTVVSIEVTPKARDKDKRDASDEDPCKDADERELYGDLNEIVEDAVIETVSEDDDLVVYRLKPRDKDKGLHMGGVHVDVGDDELKNLEGTLRVVKTGDGAPYVERLAFNLKEPAGNLVARLGQLDIVFTYAPEPATGAKLMTGMSVDLQLKLFTMFNITTHVRSSYDEYRRVK